ncbi:hypothetical protein [Hydrogenimonas sp.]
MKFRGLRLLAAVGAAYALFYLFNVDKTVLALHKSGAVLAKILPIFLLVIGFTALINYLLKPKEIASHLGERSGVKGWAIALTAGIHKPWAYVCVVPDDRRSQTPWAQKRSDRHIFLRTLHQNPPAADHDRLFRFRLYGHFDLLHSGRIRHSGIADRLVVQEM